MSVLGSAFLKTLLLNATSVELLAIPIKIAPTMRVIYYLSSVKIALKNTVIAVPKNVLISINFLPKKKRNAENFYNLTAANLAKVATKHITTATFLTKTNSGKIESQICTLTLVNIH